MKKIAFFDFDGTITTKDSMLELIKFYKGDAAYWFGLLLNAPYVALFKLKLMPRQKAKEKLLAYFFRGMRFADFEQLCLRFYKEKMAGLIRPGALSEIRKLKADGFTVVVVSASPENWIRPWTEQVGADLLASQLAVDQDTISGALTGSNCHGNEKVRRIEAAYHLQDYSTIYAYGDTSGDRPMLALASKAFYKPFRA